MKKSWVQKVVAIVLVFALCFGIAPGNGYGGVLAKAEETVIPLVNGDFANDLWGDNKGWTTTSEGSYTVTSTSDGHAGELNYYKEEAGTITLTQTVSNLSAGSYQLSAQIYGQNASISFTFGDSKDASGKTPASTSAYSDVSSDVFTLAEDGEVTVGFTLDVQAGGWGYIDNVSLKRIENTSGDGNTDEEGYKIVVTPSATTATAGDTVSLVAKVTNDGSEITDLGDLKLWWWTDTWGNHTDGKNDADYSNYDNGSGKSLSADVTLPSEGTYYICAELKNGDTSLAKVFTTITVNTAENGGGEDIDMSTAVDGDLNITKVPDLSDDFIMGMDISSVISLFASGVTFKDYDGNTIDNVTDFCKFLASQGITHIRVRVWKDPYDSNGNGYGGGNNDVTKAKQIADGCRAAGIKMLVDFHCSDLWTDPGKQQAPKEWKNYSVDQKAAALTAYLTEALNEIDPAKNTVAMVQVGNETTSGFVGETDETNMCTLFSAGSEGVKAYNPNVKVVIHVTNPEKGNVTKWAKNLNDNNVDYDIIATSYYPYWHGTFANLKSEFQTVKNTYNKDVMVAETSYAYTLEDSDGHDNTVRVGNNDTGGNCTEPFTVQGQATSIRNLINLVNEAGGLGVFYWEPAWLTVGDIRGLEGDALEAQITANKQKWEKYGSGWASSYAAEYDAKDAGQWFGGTAVDNEAMFYPDGTPTAGLHVWNYVKTGAVNKTVSVDAVGAAAETIEAGKQYALPERVTVSYNTGNVEDSVTWNSADVAKIDTGKTGTYVIHGTIAFSKEITAGVYKGQTSANTTYTLTVISPNLITDVDDASFNNGTNYVHDTNGIDAIPAKGNDNTPYDAEGCMHWTRWQKEASQSCATYQKGITLEAGKYTLELKAQGYAGDKVSLNILDGLDENAKVLFTGEAAMMSGYPNWQTPSVSFTLTEETTVYLQIVVDIQAGGWGTADMLYLYRNEDNSGSGTTAPGTSGGTTSGGTTTGGTTAPSAPDTGATTNPGSTTTEVIKLPEIAKDTDAIITVTKDASGTVTSAQADVTKVGTTKSGATTATLSGAVVAQLTAAAGTDTVKVTMTVVDTKGKTKYTVTADADELEAGKKLTVVAVDPKTGEYVLVNDKTYTVSKSGNVKLALENGADYELITPEEAKAVEKAILKTVKVKKASATVKKGKTTKIQFSSALNMKNVKKVTYSTSKKSVAKVSKNGKISAKKSGTVTIKAKVTLQNGKTKTVSMKIKVK